MGQKELLKIQYSESHLPVTGSGEHKDNSLCFHTAGDICRMSVLNK